jgi:hypothetical protein
MIEDLITTGAAKTGLNKDRVRFALAGALGLLNRHGARAPVDALFAAVPGAEALARSPEGKPKSSGGLFGGLMKSAGGVSGAAMAEGMGLLNVAGKVGIDKAALKALLATAEDYVKQASGRDLLREALESVPGVGGLLRRGG